MKAITYTAAARRQLRKLPETVQAQVKADLASYAKTGAGGVVKMQGRADAWRLRSGDYRIVFEVEDEVVSVKKVGHRRDIYR